MMKEKFTTKKCPPIGRALLLGYNEFTCLNLFVFTDGHLFVFLRIGWFHGILNRFHSDNDFGFIR